MGAHSSITTIMLIGTCLVLHAGCKPANTNNSFDTPLTATATTLPAAPIPAPPSVQGKGFIMMDFFSGAVLAAENENTRLDPASLTKLMTSYVVFDALREGKIKLNDNVTISEYAWRVGGASSSGSTSFLPLGSQVPVETLIQGMTVQSGNDASIALAEHIAGDESTFAQLMNAYAQRLGMVNSGFGNATGLPSPLDFSTPHDMALLATALIRDFPEHYHYFAELEFTYNGITQHNRNGLLRSDPTVDGLKTGHTDAAGYCLVSSAKRNGMRLITVVMGTPSVKIREQATTALLNYGFNFYETRQLYSAQQAIKQAVVWKGISREVAVGTKEDIWITLPRGQVAAVQTQLEIQPTLIAPLARDTSIGIVKLTLNGEALTQHPLYPLNDIAAAGFMRRSIDSVRLWF